MITHRWPKALVGVAYICVLAGLITLSVMVFNKDFVSTVHVRLVTDDVGSALQKGSDVKVRGLLVGEVTGVHTNGDGATLDLALSPAKAKQLPANVSARLLPKTLFGERYVSLMLPPSPSGHTLRSGDQISQDRSARAVELEQVFDNLLPVLQAVQPEKLATMLGEFSEALRNRGTELGQTFVTIERYLRKFLPKVPELESDLDAFASVLDTYNTAAPDLLSALSDMTTTSKTLVAQRQQLQVLFATVSQASDTIDGFVTSNSDTIISLSKDSLPSLTIAATYSHEFPCISKALANFIPTMNRVLGAGTNQPGLHVQLHDLPGPLPYQPGSDKPQPYNDRDRPRCPYVPSAGVANTALSTSSSTQHARTDPALASQDLGTANSPGENQLIAELMGPTVGVAPSQFPKWGSLLLGPVLRGTEVTVK
jgi:phospholipid/cholesterol/gamma-HCH transport system substrate-binding protein